MQSITKKCTKCGDTKDINEFNKDRSKIDGLRPSCRSCKKINDNDWYKRNKVRCREWGIKYRRGEKREEILDRKRIYTAAHRMDKKKYDAAAQHYRKGRSDELVSDGTVTVPYLAELLLSQNGKCFHCGNGLDFDNPKTIHLDHLVSSKDGGKHTKLNVAWSCESCNCSKKGKSIIEPLTMRRS